ncbi:hypothetical protein [Streptomyces sp. KN37]|uniref:hypothetical protein n=1 Tax=Streptomyces sp. KN37 TaxID=3090667 RepID=UPI002A75B6B5|nr:hypothetical protein [Streptomyces sp. KN37]WPO71707.1 hypothetical protein R9806_14230 [Streptomyces sp. KN37]
MMIPAACAAALLCLIEGSEATALLSRRRPRPWGPVCAALASALGVLVVLVVLVSVSAALPPRAVRLVAATAVLLIGLQWLARAVLRLLGPPRPDERTAFAVVLAAAVEAVLACVALAASVDASVPLWAACGVVSVALAALGGLAARRTLPDPPQRVPKAVLALALTATGAGVAGPAGWWATAAAATAVTLAVLFLRGLPSARKAPEAPAGPKAPEAAKDVSGVRGFLLGDTAVTWPAAAGFTALAVVVAAPWRPVLLALLVAVVLLAATGRRTPGRP